MTERPQNTGMDSKIQAKTDRIDLNNEMSGIDNGKQWRFFPTDSPTNPREKEKKKSELKYQNLLDMLLSEDPIYAALYTKVTEKIEKAQHAVDLALIDINERLEASDRKLQILLDGAAELADGTKVFKSSIDNSIYTEHGTRLSAEESQDIIFTGNEPNLEKFKDTKADNNFINRQKVEVETYQRDVLDSASSQIKDKKNPASMDELKELMNNGRIESEMPDIVKSKLYDRQLTTKRPSISNAHEQIEKTKLNVPDMDKAFNSARIDIPNLDTKPEIDSTPAKTLG